MNAAKTRRVMQDRRSYPQYDHTLPAIESKQILSKNAQEIFLVDHFDISRIRTSHMLRR